MFSYVHLDNNSMLFPPVSLCLPGAFSATPPVNLTGGTAGLRGGVNQRIILPSILYHSPYRKAALAPVSW